MKSTTGVCENIFSDSKLAGEAWVSSKCVCLCVVQGQLPAEGDSEGSLTVPQKPPSWACH